MKGSLLLYNLKLNCLFLRAKAECFARLCHRLGVCPSVCPFVCHTHDLYQNGAN